VKSAVGHGSRCNTVLRNVGMNPPHYKNPEDHRLYVYKILAEKSEGK